VVVRCNYGLWSFGREFPCGVQIKTRNPAGDPFKAKDEEVLNAISKFAKRLDRRHLNKGYSSGVFISSISQMIPRNRRRGSR
jgi:hypothetical protein